jgi:hypothetical protein
LIPQEVLDFHAACRTRFIRTTWLQEPTRQNDGEREHSIKRHVPHGYVLIRKPHVLDADIKAEESLLGASERRALRSTPVNKDTPVGLQTAGMGAKIEPPRNEAVGHNSLQSGMIAKVPEAGKCGHPTELRIALIPAEQVRFASITAPGRPNSRPETGSSLG